MAELETKFCGWKIKHEPHHIVQVSTDSFNCLGYDLNEEPHRFWLDHNWGP